MGFFVVRVRRKQIDVLSARFPEAGGDVKVFTLNIENDQRIGIVEAIRNNNTDALTASGRRSKQNKLVSGVRQIVVFVHSDQNGFIKTARRINQAGFFYFAEIGKSCRPVQSTFVSINHDSNADTDQRNPRQEKARMDC